jgi:hypothetical protein
LLGQGVVVDVQQGVVDVEHHGWMARAVGTVLSRGEVAFGGVHDLLHLPGVVAGARRDGDSADDRVGRAGRAVVVLDLADGAPRMGEDVGEHVIGT